MYLYLIRHGQSEENIGNYATHDPALTALGRQQAEELAAKLAGEGLDLLIASPFLRAVQTVLPLQRRTGLPLEIWQHLGEFRRSVPAPFLGRAGIQALCPEARFADEGHPEEPFLHGHETFASVNDRARSIVERLHSRFAQTDLKIGMVAHGTFNNILLMAMIGWPYDQVFEVIQQNCCINRIAIGPDRIRVHAMNETSHLSTVS